ncbi:MAG: helical backbone metal receptor [Rhodocyclaceae bacterium]
MAAGGAARLVDAAGTAHAPAQGDVRIVSLVPSLTELVCDLGLGAALVGRTGFCVHPREALRAVPKVGGTKDVRIHSVRALAPTHLIVNIDENRREDVAAMKAFVPHVIVTHPQRPEDNLELYALFGGIFGRAQAAQRLAGALREALAEARGAASVLPRERVLYLVWREPWMSVARDTYVSATLAAAGWDSLPAHADARYPALRMDEPWLGDIDRVLLPSEPYPFRPRHAAEVAAVPALAGKPVEFIDGEMTSWYGSRAPAGLRYLAALRTRLAGR